MLLYGSGKSLEYGGKSRGVTIKKNFQTPLLRNSIETLTSGLDSQVA